jgi:predicted O-linked N-acetylglucosamine transferase (SPINDLY family)
MRYALALLATKHSSAAEKHLRHAVAVKPNFHEAWDNLAYCLKTQNRLPEAIACHEKALALAPGYAAGWYNFGLTLSLSGRVFEALNCHDRALEADSDYALARFGRAQALQQTHRIPEAVEEYGRFLALQPQHHEARSYRLFALHYVDDVSRDKLLEEHVAYGRGLGKPIARNFSNSIDHERRLRIAVLSPDLRTHSCAFFIEPLLRHLDRTQFEIYLYHDHFREDAVSEQLRAHAEVWRNFVGQPDLAVEKTILADAPDVLIDLAGHTGLNRLPLLARRLAPVQITYLGYPNTTGVAAMDYRFTDFIADPQGDADAYATERLFRFAPTAWTYAPPPEAPPIVSAPCVARGYVTFGCFNNLAKITDSTLELWGRVLAAVPNSRLRLKGRGLGDPSVRARYEARLLRCGLPKAQVELLERTAEPAAHLALYNDVDIAFDSFPYHGTTTTCEALWMGVPVACLAGNEHRSRVGASLLTAVGHREWIASDRDEFVRIAAELANNCARLDAIRGALRQQMLESVLLDHSGQAARFGLALRACWASWCEQASRTAA